jgi:hypothetical protein
MKPVRVITPLAAGIVLVLAASGLLLSPAVPGAAAAAPNNLVVNLGSATGAFDGGASGACTGSTTRACRATT